jgi:hypothetical protein
MVQASGVLTLIESIESEEAGRFFDDFNKKDVLSYD